MRSKICYGHLLSSTQHFYDTEMSQLKRLLKGLVFLPLYFIEKIFLLYLEFVDIFARGFKYRWLDKVLFMLNNQLLEIKHSNSSGELALNLYVPNSLCRLRANSFSIKEPETLEWIDRFGGTGAFFDVGANIGLYSLYYSATKKGKVFAFEPSVLNLALLAKNISVNDLSNSISIVPLPLTDVNGFSMFKLSSTDEGGALSAFGVDFGYDGKPIKNVMEYGTLGLSLDYLVSSGLINEPPALIKIDVDGIEHLVLKGALRTLKHPNCISVLIEVNQHFVEQLTSVRAIMLDSGFELETQANFKGGSSSRFSSTANEIWVKRL